MRCPSVNNLFCSLEEVSLFLDITVTILLSDTAPMAEFCRKSTAVHGLFSEICWRRLRYGSSSLCTCRKLTLVQILTSEVRQLNYQRFQGLNHLWRRTFQTLHPPLQLHLCSLLLHDPLAFLQPHIELLGFPLHHQHRFVPLMLNMFLLRFRFGQRFDPGSLFIDLLSVGMKSTFDPTSGWVS